MSLQFQIKRGVEASIPALASGEMYFATDTGVLHIGNGGNTVVKALLTGSILESQVTGLVADLGLKAPLASPALTGAPTAPTAAGGTNTTQLATTAFVHSAVISISLSTLLDVLIVSAANRNLLIYNTSAGKWENQFLVAADIPNLAASIITSGTLALARGGTNADLSATGGTSQVLKQTSVGGNVTVGQLASTDLSDASSLATLTGAQTLTNKRITKRVVALADATSFTLSADTADMNTQANTQTAGTLTANVPSGTPTDGQQLIFRIKSTNVQTYSWNAIFRGSTTTALPTASTGTSKTDYLGFIYNGADSKWDLVAYDAGR